MINISKKEKYLALITSFFISFIFSFFLLELLNLPFGSRFHISDVYYNFSHFHYALFMPSIIPFFMIKNIDSYSKSIYIITSGVLTVLIPAILYFAFITTKKIRLGAFKSNLTKWLNYLLLFCCCELWFLIGLIPAGMARI